MSAFHPSFVALRGTPEQTRAAAKEFKVFFAKVPGKTEGSYTLDHTAASFLFDPQGRVRVYTRYGSGPKAPGRRPQGAAGRPSKRLGVYDL